MDDNINVVMLFKDLTPAQIKKLTARITQILPTLRDEVVGEDDVETQPHEGNFENGLQESKPQEKNNLESPDYEKILTPDVKAIKDEDERIVRKAIDMVVEQTEKGRAEKEQELLTEEWLLLSKEHTKNAACLAEIGTKLGLDKDNQTPPLP